MNNREILDIPKMGESPCSDNIKDKKPKEKQNNEEEKEKEKNKNSKSKSNQEEEKNIKELEKSNETNKDEKKDNKKEDKKEENREIINVEKKDKEKEDTKEINKDDNKGVNKENEKKEGSKNIKKDEEKKDIRKEEENKDIKKDEDKNIKKEKENKEAKNDQEEINKKENDKKPEDMDNKNKNLDTKTTKKENGEKLEKKEIKKEETSEELEKLINYKYNEEGELRHKETGEKVQKLSQKEYELVGKYVQKYVEELLIKKFNLTTLYVPNDKSDDFTKRDESQAQCKIVITKDFSTNPKCLMLIQGTGAVRLGQWARSVCINENIYLGSMIPYVEQAIKNNLSVIIFNPNERRDFLNEEKRINEFYTMEDHSVYVYNNIVKTNKNIKDIYIVAHSMGGSCTVQILLENKEDLLNGKIKKIAFTDSVHGEQYKNLGKDGVEQFRKISRNYVTSQKPAGEFIRDYSISYGGVDCYSSGHSKHEYTSGYAIDEIFKYFNADKEKEK